MIAPTILFPALALIGFYQTLVLDRSSLEQDRAKLLKVKLIDEEVLFGLSLAFLHSLAHQVEVLLDRSKSQQIVAAVFRPQGHLASGVVIQGETLTVGDMI